MIRAREPGNITWWGSHGLSGHQRALGACTYAPTSSQWPPNPHLHPHPQLILSSTSCSPIYLQTPLHQTQLYRQPTFLASPLSLSLRSSIQNPPLSPPQPIQSTSIYSSSPRAPISLLLPPPTTSLRSLPLQPSSPTPSAPFTPLSPVLTPKSAPSPPPSPVMVLTYNTVRGLISSPAISTDSSIYSSFQLSCSPSSHLYPIQPH